MAPRLKLSNHPLLMRHVRKIRKRIPYPKFWAAVAGVRIPSSSITGRSAILNRPEGVAFTRTGDLMAVSNSEGNALNIYKRKDGAESAYHREPCFRITDPARLNYVHDVAFSPCGKMLAAAAREDHSVSVFVSSEDQPVAFGARGGWLIRGGDSGLGFPSGVAFHPSGECLAVANRDGNGITLYRCRRSGEDSGLDSIPFQSISEANLLEYDFAPPHGLEFSADGTSLIATHKRFFKTGDPQGESGLSIFRWKAKPQFGLESTPSYTLTIGNYCLHSVAFHPSGKIFAVTNEKADVEIYEWRSRESSISKIDAISIFREGRKEGPKGVAFTSDGEQLAVTTTLDQVLFFSKWANEYAGSGGIIAAGR